MFLVLRPRSLRTTALEHTELWSCLQLYHLTLHVQFSSVTQLCPTFCDPMDCSTPGFPVLHHLLELAQIHIHWVGGVIQPSCLLSSPSPPVFYLSQHQGLFQALHIGWSKYWSFNLSISPSNEYSRLISFRIYWFDLLAVQGTLKSLLQYHGSKASILRHSAFFIVQLSHPYMTRKNHSFDKTCLCWQRNVSVF